MTRLLKVLTATIIILSISFGSCNNEKEIIEKNENKELKNSIFSIEETKILQNYYGFDSFRSDIDKSENFNFISEIYSCNIAQNEIDKDSEKLDFENIVQIGTGETITYTIPYKGNQRKHLVFPTFNENSDAFVIENFLDDEDSGYIYITTIDDYIQMTFEDGVLIDCFSNNKAGSSFQSCFNNIYNTICDGAPGCIAWHTNPQLPILAAIYCGILTSPRLN